MWSHSFLYLYDMKIYWKFHTMTHGKKHNTFSTWKKCAAKSTKDLFTLLCFFLHIIGMGEITVTHSLTHSLVTFSFCHWCALSIEENSYINATEQKKTNIRFSRSMDHGHQWQNEKKWVVSRDVHGGAAMAVAGAFFSRTLKKCMNLIKF